MNDKMLTLGEKLQTAPPLLPMLVRGQDFIDEQDELSVLDFMRKYGMPERINEEVFVAMAKALDFIDPDKLSMTVVLTAMNRFLNEDNGLQMAFLDGNQPDRVCKPMQQFIEANGGKVHLNTPLKEIVTNADGTVKHLLMRDGSTVVADMYVSAMPVDIVKRYVPEAWQLQPFFRQFDELEGIPVINIHLWFDTKLTNVDHLCFSRSPLLSVYADMSTTCKEYFDTEKSMLELVFAPCSPIAGGKVNWIAKPDAEIVAATLVELERLFPTEIAADGSKAKLLKSAVVKVPRSVYAAIPPEQVPPVPRNAHFELRPRRRLDLPKVPRVDGRRDAGRQARGRSGGGPRQGLAHQGPQSGAARRGGQSAAARPQAAARRQGQRRGGVRGRRGAVQKRRGRAAADGPGAARRARLKNKPSIGF